MNEEELKRAHEEGVKILTAVLAMTIVHAKNAGWKEAHALFAQWATFFMGGALQQAKESLAVTEKTPKAFYTVMDVLEKSIGDRLAIVEETPYKITHTIHECVFREACMNLGLDPVETCRKAVAPISSTISAVINPDLEWNILECNPAPKACIYEIRYRERKDAK